MYAVVWVISVLASPEATAHLPLLKSVVLQLGIVAGLPLAVSYFLGLDWRRTFRLNLAGARNLWLSLLTSACLAIALEAVNSFQTLVLPSSAEASRAVAAYVQTDSFSRLFQLLFALALVPAICEELLFRGFLLDCFYREESRWTAILLVGAMFSAFHRDMGSFLPSWIAGILLGIVVVRAGSLYATVILHGGVNLWGILFLNRPARQFLAWIEARDFLVMAILAASLVGIVLAIKGIEQRQPVLEGSGRTIG